MSDALAGHEADVVVVGAGLAGLACARALTAAGARGHVLEARDRVGGRTLSQRVGAGTFDLGAQWLGAKQPRMSALARELAIETFPTFCRGKKLLDVAGSVSAYDGTIPKMAPWKLVEMQRAIWAIDRMTAKVPAEQPLNAPLAEDWDGSSVWAWERANVRSRDVRGVFEAAVRVVFGSETRDVSLLHFLFYLRSGGGLMPLIEIENGAQQTRFVGGAQGLSLGMAARLGERATLSLSAPVRAIEQRDDEVLVRTPKGTLRAKRVVVCVPPPLAARIEYAPALPAQRDQYTQRAPMGATVKCIALYDRAFWRERGLSGEAVCTEGPVSVVFDNTTHDGAQPSLLAFVVGQPAREWSQRSEASRRDAVLRVLVRLFGEEAARPGAYIEQDWSTEIWTRGCPVSVMAPGALTAVGGVWRAPVGRVHWAGTETAVHWHGFMEGALESGERAPAEVLSRL